MIFDVFGRFSLVFGLVSYSPGPILESVFLWRVSVDRNLPVSCRQVKHRNKCCGALRRHTAKHEGSRRIVKTDISVEVNRSVRLGVPRIIPCGDGKRVSDVVTKVTT